ncbi:hypothetical protein HMSSN036_26310 [Paenibacillus macerans]|nr:hypothetical protein HMSSN036_26310 [Paenibacillus macerans]
METLMSEAPNYGHMTTSEAYSYWMWLEVLYGYYTEDWSKLEEAWDNMEKYIIPVNEGDGKEEQPTMNYYNPNSPATYAAEYPQPDRYPSELTGQYAGGKDPLDAELKKTYGNNQTYLMHWLLDVDNWYGFGNLLNPNHTAAYVNTFQRGEQESVWEAIPHPSQDDKSFGKAGEGFMSLFTKENQAPAAQWRYTNATDADARAVQAMYWAKELGYDNEEYLDKARKMGDYLRYGMYDKYFQEIGSAADGSPTPGQRQKCQPLSDGLVYVLGRRSRKQRQLGLADRRQPRPPRVSKRGRGLRSLQPGRRADSRITDSRTGLGYFAEAPAGILHLAAIRRRSDRRRRDEQLGRRLQSVSGRNEHVLRNGLRRRARLPRPAVQQLVRHAGMAGGTDRGIVLYSRRERGHFVGKLPNGQTSPR